MKTIEDCKKLLCQHYIDVREEYIHTFDTRTSCMPYEKCANAICREERGDFFLRRLYDCFSNTNIPSENKNRRKFFSDGREDDIDKCT